MDGSPAPPPARKPPPPQTHQPDSAVKIDTRELASPSRIRSRPVTKEESSVTIAEQQLAGSLRKDAQQQERSSKLESPRAGPSPAFHAARFATIKLASLQNGGTKAPSSPQAKKGHSTDEDPPDGVDAAVFALPMPALSLHPSPPSRSASGNASPRKPARPYNARPEGDQGVVLEAASTSGRPWSASVGEGHKESLSAKTGRVPGVGEFEERRPAPSPDSGQLGSPSKRRVKVVEALGGEVLDGWAEGVGSDDGPSPQRAPSRSPRRLNSSTLDESGVPRVRAGSVGSAGAPNGIAAVAAGLRVLRNMQREVSPRKEAPAEERNPGGVPSEQQERRTKLVATSQNVRTAGGPATTESTDTSTWLVGSEEVSTRESVPVKVESMRRAQSDHSRVGAPSTGSTIPVAPPDAGAGPLAGLLGAPPKPSGVKSDAAILVAPAKSLGSADGLPSQKPGPTPHNLHKLPVDSLGSRSDAVPSQAVLPEHSLGNPHSATPSSAPSKASKSPQQRAASTSMQVQRSGDSFSLWAQPPPIASSPPLSRTNSRPRSPQLSRLSSKNMSDSAATSPVPENLTPSGTGPTSGDPGRAGVRNAPAVRGLQQEPDLVPIASAEMPEFHLPRVRVHAPKKVKKDSSGTEAKEGDAQQGSDTSTGQFQRVPSGKRAPRRSSFAFNTGGTFPGITDSMEIGVEVTSQNQSGVFTFEQQLQPSDSEAYTLDRGNSGQSEGIPVDVPTISGAKPGRSAFRRRSDRTSDASQDDRLERTVRFSQDSDGGDGATQATPRTAQLLARYHRKPATRNFAMQTEDFSKSLFFLEATNPFRMLCRRVVEHRLFSHVMLVCILGSCVDMATYSPTQAETSHRNRLVRRIDIGFIAVFFLEMALKIVAYGFLLNPTAYLRSPLNVLDFILTWASLVVLLPTGGRALPLGFLRVLRVVRVLRPLRTVSASPTMRVLVGTVFSSLPRLGNVSLLLCFFLTFFGIMGVQLFGGSLDRQCVDASGAFTDGRRCSAHGKPWAHMCPPGTSCEHTGSWPCENLTSFSNLPRAAIVLFEAISLEGWSDNMYATVEAEGVWAVFYWITVVVFGAFAIMNLALAVVYDNFKKRKQEEHVRAENMRRMRIETRALNSTPRHPPRSPLWQALRSPKQAFDSFRQRFRNSSKKALSSKSLASAHDHLAPGTPSYSSNFRHTDRFTDELDEGEMIEERVSWQHRIRHGLFLVRRKWRRMRKNLRMTLSRPRVDIGFILVVAFNLLVLALRYEGAPRKLRRAINGVDVACTIVFLLEVSLRALAHGPLPFCRDPFNAFDAAMFVMALVDFGTSGRVIHNVASMRTFRVLRVFQLAGQWPSLAIFLSSVFSALRAVRPFAFLLLLFILVSALLGMQILAGKLSFPDGEPRSNYDNFFWACLTTFQVIANYNWNDVLASAIRGIGWWAAPYVIFVHVAGGTILLNLLLAILIESFEENTQREQLLSGELRKKFLSAGMALKQKMARFRARAQNMRSTNNLLKGKSADVSEPLTPKILATMLSPRAFLRRIRDQSARKPAAAEVARDLLSPPEPPSPTAAAAKEETKGKNEMQLAIPLSASLRGLPIDPEVFDSTGSTPLNTGTNSPAATPPLTPQGSARFDPGDLARIIKDGRGEKKGGFTRFRREDSSLKSALADALPQLAAGHERRKSRMTTSTSSHEDVTSTKALAACAKLGIDLAKPLDLNATWRAGTPLRLRNRGGSGLPAEEINRVTPLSPRAASSLLAEQSDNVLDPVAEPSPNPNGDTLHLDEPAPSTSSGEPTEELPSSAVPRGLRGRKQRTARFLEGLKSVSSQKKVSLPSSGEETNMGILPVPNLPRLHMPGAKVASADGKKPRALQRSTSSPHIVLRPARGGHTKATEKRRLTRRLSITALMKPKVQWKSLIRLIDQRPLKKPSLARHLSFAHIPSLHLRSDPITILARKATRGREKGPLRRGSSKAFFLLKDQHPLRIKIHQLIADKRFARLVTAVVVVSMLILMADRPSMREGGREWKGIVMLDAVFAGLFATEVLLKMTALGVLFEPGAYLRDPWNVLDALCTLTTLISVAAENRWPLLHVFRVFRALRLAQTAPGLRMVAAALLGAFRASTSVVMIGAVIFLVFATLGVQIFGGAFSMCTDLEVQLRDDCVGVDAYNKTREWVQSVPYTFDNLGASALTLFELSTTENANYLMYPGMDSVSVDHAPVLNYRPYASLFFIAFIAIGSLFLINLFVGIVIESFGNIKKDKEIEGLTSMQQEWVETQKAIEKMRYHAALRPPAKRSFARALRASFFNLVQHPYFDRAFAAAIALNLVILCTQEVPPGARTRAVARYSGWIFAGVFSAEVAAKLLGLGVRQFFQHRWNLFDLVILVMTITGEAMADRPGAPLVRCFRVLRMLKLARTHHGLNKLLKSLVSALPNLYSVGSLLLLQLYIFAIFAVALFGHVPQDGPLGSMTSLINFTTFPHSLLVMFKMLTGENWNFIMHDCMVVTWLAVPFFVTFVVLGQFVLLNLVIAIIIEAFSEVEDEDSRVVNTVVLRKFDAVWTRHDPTATGWITPEQLYLLLTDLGEPLGVKRADESALRPSPSAVLPLASKMNIPIFSRGVPYDLVLHSLVTIAFMAANSKKLGTSVFNTQWCEYQAEKRLRRLLHNKLQSPRRKFFNALPKKLQALEKKKNHDPAKIMKTMSVSKAIAAMTIQAHARGIVTRIRLRKQGLMPLTPMNSPMLRAENDVSAGAFGGAPRSLRPGGIQTALSAPPKQLGASAFLMSSVSSVARGGPSRAQSEASGLMKALRSSAELLPSERPTRGLARGTSDVAGLLKQGSGDLGRSRTVHFATGKSEGPPPNVGPSYGEVSPRVKGDEAAETIDSVWKRLNHSLPPKVSPGVSAIRSVSGRRVRLSFEEPEDEKAELSDDKIVALEEAEGFVFDAHASHAR